MPRKAPTKKPVASAPNPEQGQVAAAPPPAHAPEVCGHVNRHSVGLDKKLDNMSCDLRPGHHGDHEGWHTEYQRHDETRIVKGEEETFAVYEAVDIRRQWSDAAGIPVAEIPPPPPPEQPTMAALDKRVMRLEGRPK